MYTIPIDQQVFFHPKALCSSVSIGTVTRPAEFRFIITLALHFRQLGQLIFRSTKGPRLFPNSWGINNQAVLQKFKQPLSEAQLVSFLKQMAPVQKQQFLSHVINSILKGVSVNTHKTSKIFCGIYSNKKWVSQRDASVFVTNNTEYLI